MNNNWYFFIFIILLIMGCTQATKKIAYIDVQQPDRTPKIFAPGIVSKKDRSEFGSVFTKSGSEFYYAVDSAGKAKIWMMQLEQGKWSEPISVIPDIQYSYNDPFLSPTEDRLYYISNKPSSASDTLDDIDIWYSERNNGLWSAPINAGPNINSDRHEYYISFTSEGTMYFASNKNHEPKRKHDFDIYSAAFVNGIFQSPVKLSDSINTRGYEADVFVAPDESYLIYCAARRSGFGSGDLYISFKDNAGQWTKSKNMGAEINTEHNELCPFVTLDGKYLFYTSNQDIYWVSTKILEGYR